MSTQTPATHYYGEFEHRLDARSRVTVPSAWRVDGDEENFYFAWPHPEGCIAVFPPAMLAELNAKAHEGKVSDLQANRLRRAVFARGSQFGCDKQGRILLPRSLMDHAGIEKDAILVGVGRYYEVWDPERYRKVTDGDFDMLSAMQALGL